LVNFLQARYFFICWFNEVLRTHSFQSFVFISVLENLRFLSEQQAEINLRLILLDEINAEELDAEEVIAWLAKEKIHVSEISLLPYPPILYFHLS
jgi:pyruvate-formate lyase-activating enzyme